MKQSIEKNWLTWLSLHHFLPNKHLLILLDIVLEKISIEPKLKLNDIFEIESITSDNSVISKFFTRKIHSENQQIVYIQSLFQNIFSKDDDYFESIKSIKFQNLGKIDEADNSIKTVLVALILGCQEILGASKNAKNIFDLPELQQHESFILLCKLLIQVENFLNEKDIKDSIFSDFKSFDIIEVLIIKHLGDLLFEADKIELALKMYEFSNTFIKKINSQHNYEKEYELWSDILEHSIFSCQRIIKGAEFSVKNLYDKSSKVNFNRNLSFLINSKVDMDMDNKYLSFNLMEKFKFKNSYIYSIEENFLATSNFYNMNYFNGKISSDTLRKIRGRLRRQIAIGSSYYVKALKSTYGKAIIYQFIDYKFNKAVFLNGIKQIISSEFSDTIKQISQENQWKPFHIENNLDISDFEELFIYSTRFEGSKERQLKIFVELLNSWLEYIKNEKIISDIWSIFIKISKEYKSSFYSENNVGGKSLEVLNKLSQEYSNLKVNFSQDILNLFQINLEKENFWKGISDTFELLENFIDVFSEEQLLETTSKTTKFLSDNEKILEWPIERAAIRLLLLILSDKKLTNSKIQDETWEVLLKYGFNDEGNSITTFGFIKDFPKDIVKKFNVNEKIKPAISSLLEDASQYNSSRTSSSIHALLTVYDYLLEEQKDLLNNYIKQIIDNALSDKSQHDLAFETLYNPILYLIKEYNNKKLPWLENLLNELFDKILKLWVKAKKNPEIFSYSYPLSNEDDSMNQTKAYYWSVTSIRLADSLNKINELQNNLISNFKDNDDLNFAILSAIISENVFKDLVKTRDFNLILKQIKTLKDSSKFYKLLPLLLVGYQKVSKSLKIKILTDSLNKILDWGPKEIDNSIFSLILTHNKDLFEFDKLKFESYRNKLINSKNEENKNTLPLFNALYLYLKTETKTTG